MVVKPEVTHQSLVGFGASLAWYQGLLATHPRADELFEDAFPQLGLDILRYRNRFQRSSEPSDLTDEATILERATASLGYAPEVLLTSWSPPGALKASGVENCDGNASTCTLVRDGEDFAYRAFAEYWADSLEEYRAAGITATWFSIQNEPDFTPNGWEGCRFDPTETANLPGYDRALATVAASLEERGDTTKLIGPETQGVHYERVESYMTELDPAPLAAVAHHLYESGSDGVWDWRTPGPDSFISPLRGAANAARGLPVFQTEFGTDGDNGVDGGFETAWLIQNSLVEQGASAFLYWELVWPGKGLISLLPGDDLEDRADDDYLLRDQYYAVRHFARHTDPGDVRVETSSMVLGVRASAFVSPEDDRLTIVLLNVADATRTVTLDLAGFGAESTETIQSVFDPGRSSLWNDLGALDGLLHLPPRSVTTVVAR